MCPDDTATSGSWAGGGLVNWDLDLLRRGIGIQYVWISGHMTALMKTATVKVYKSALTLQDSFLQALS
jgi:hypothetical protein